MTRVNGRAPGTTRRHRPEHEVREQTHMGWWCVQCHRFFTRHPDLSSR